MSWKQGGLRSKYIILKRDPCGCGCDRYCENCKGQGYTTEQPDPGAEYFVLKPSDDPCACVALAAYYYAVKSTNMELAKDLEQMLHRASGYACQYLLAMTKSLDGLLTLWPKITGHRWPLDDEEIDIIQDLLGLAALDVPKETIAKWTDQQIAEAEEYVAGIHTWEGEGDPDWRPPPIPDFLKEFENQT